LDAVLVKGAKLYFVIGFPYLHVIRWSGVHE